METPAPLTPLLPQTPLLSQDLYSPNGLETVLSPPYSPLRVEELFCASPISVSPRSPLTILRSGTNSMTRMSSATSVMPLDTIIRPSCPPPILEQPQPYSPKKKPGKFRIHAKSLFLTYPRCQMSKEQIMEGLLSFPKQILWAMVVQENHQDGTPHIHVALSFLKKEDITTPRDLDMIGGKHGNYQGIRNVTAVIQYIGKHDKEPLVHGPVPQTSKKPPGQQVNKGDVVTKMLIEGRTRKEIMEKHPGYYLLNRMKILALEAELPTLTRKTIQTTHQIEMRSGDSSNEEEMVVYNWLAANLFNAHRPLKTQQLYIWGAPNSNKTSLYHRKLDFLRIYHMPNSELFDCLYSDDGYDLVIYDEFTKSRVRSGAFLNQFSDGQHVTLRTKGGQVLKKKNIPFIILSNFSPSQCLECSELPSFLARFTVVELKAPLNLDNLVITMTPLPDTASPIIPDAIPL